MFKSWTTLAFVLSACAANAGDRVGNGGGLWACKKADGDIVRSQLVDLYEASNEFQWPEAQLIGQTSDIVSAVESANERDLPTYAGAWKQALSDVQSRIVYVNGDLTYVDDDLHRLSPTANTCPEGQWKYTQFANYTAFNQVDVSSSLWNSNIVSARSKAALVWHEAIYLWLRQTYNDTDSTRARYINGILFSGLSAPDKNSKIADILQSAPATGNLSWFCSVAATDQKAIYGAYGLSQLDGQTRAMQACQKASQNAPYECSSFRTQCEQLTSIQTNLSCSVTNAFSGQVFSGSGRGELETKFEAIRSCVQGTSTAPVEGCFSRDPECQPYCFFPNFFIEHFARACGRVYEFHSSGWVFGSTCRKSSVARGANPSVAFARGGKPYFRE